jgi:3'-phosphoadenosine 5'-phosphosulfate sulfotransferase (PAPS reductase)/FAD synthetase
MNMTGDEVIEQVRMSHSQTMLAFSTGKDAIATWLAIRDRFDEVHPYYLYLVPNLEFVEESLDYYERFFGKKIIRLPHPSLHRWLNTFTFQTPDRVAVIKQANLPWFDFLDVRKVIVEDKKLPDDILVADGVRAADSPMRRISIKRHGAISLNQRRYHPIWDWKKQNLVDCFRKNDIQLPVDYQLFGRSFDGLDLRFLLPLKKHRPDDYRRILDWFPCADLEVFRWERSNANR